MTKYRYDIGISEYPYGMELEFTNACLQTINEKLNQEFIPTDFIIGHKKSDTIYDRNYLDKDTTVSADNYGIIYGGEISSRLFYNEKSDWEEIEKICNILIENNAEIKGNCSNHISVKLSKIKEKNKFIEALTKVVANYEQELEMYYMGDYYLEREAKFYYAYSLSIYLRNLLTFLEFKSDCDWEVNKIVIPMFEKRAGINLVDFNDKKRIEIRYPNGTLNKKTIQNNINFSLKLIDALATDKFELKKILSEILKHSHIKNYYDNMSDQTHLKRFESLVRTISTSSEDENDLMSQYEKVLSTKSNRR